MNKIYTLSTLVLLFVAMFSVSLVLAEENDTNVTEISLISAPVNDSSNDEVVSGWKYGWEKFKLNFIWNQEKKAERELQLAKWKIAEAKLAIKNGNLDKAEKAMEAHDEILGKFKERISKMENKSLTPGLDQAMAVHEEKIANLELAYENSNLTEQQRERIQERISKMTENSQNLEEVRLKIEEKARERIQERVENMQNKTEKMNETAEQIQERIRERIEQNNSVDSLDENESDLEDSGSNTSSKKN